jgi:hypothetical protein
MKQRLKRKWLICPAVLALACVAGAFFARAAEPAEQPAPAGEKPLPIPPAVQRKVDFAKDVAPIFEASCMQCHANGKYEADFSVESRAKMLEGGASSEAFTIGKSGESLLIELVSGQDPERIMPKKGKRLTTEQIGILRAWIDQGAEWPNGVELVDANKPRPAKLEPRKVELPPVVDGQTNPIDRLLRPYFEQHKVTPAKQLVDDRTFARRAYLDVVGLLPPVEELDKFVADPSTDKRDALVKKLLGEDERYAAHWMSFWNDMLRNDYKGTGYIDGGRMQITRWLYNSLKANKPYDQFVRELVIGVPGAEGFTKGIVWRGVVNSAQTPQMQAAQGISQVFMGVNLKCASCHDSFINQWKLTDSFGLAGVYADTPLEMERCTKPLGQTAPFKFLYPELGTIDPNLPREKRIAQLAQIITNDRNGRLTRTMVNRLWARLMGRGLIEPTDEMDLPPWSQDLLDWLAQDLVDNQYDIKKTIATIATSRAYQMPPAPAMTEDKKDFVFTGPRYKRMTAEQLVDSVAEVTGAWPERMDAKLSDAAEAYGRTRWIWTEKEASRNAPVGTVYLRKVFDLKPGVAELSALMAVDNDAEVFLNGKKIATLHDNWAKPTTVDLKPHAVTGTNVFAVVATNTAGNRNANPAGFWMHVAGSYASPVKGKGKRNATSKIEVVTNPTWRLATAKPVDDAWKTAAFDDAAWEKPAIAASADGAPWNLVLHLPEGKPGDLVPEVRAVFCAADPLTTALGRPNREQVNTERPSAATTLMALELTNGATIDAMLKRGAKKIATGKDVRAEDVIDRVYKKALARPATDAEVAAAKEIVGATITPEGVADFLWAVVMLPEFQLIR